MDAFASYVHSTYKLADRNRQDLQLKWESNRKWFAGNLFPDTEKPIDNDKWKEKEGDGWRSKTFPGTTHSKVVAAFVICLDTVLAGGQVPFMMKPLAANKFRGRSGAGGMQDPAAIEAAAKEMTDLIQSQFSECKADKHLSKNFFAMALYGETYAKMGVKKITRSGWEQQQIQVPGIEDMSRVQTQGQWARWTEDILAPHWFYVTNWDMFRDWETDDMQECSYIIHRQITDNYWLEMQKGKPFFRDDEIQRAIEASRTSKEKSSPSVKNNEDTSNMAPSMRNFLTARARDRQLLEWWGRVPLQVVEEYEAKLEEAGQPPPQSLIGDESNGKEVECHGMVIEGDQTIRFVRTDVKMRPFAYARWEDNCDEWTSRGVADNCLDMSKVIRGTFRGVEDNAKLCGNPMTALKRRLLKTMPKTLTPGLFIELAEDCEDARKAMQPVIIPDVSAGMVKLYEIALQQNEQDSMVPRIAQGQQENTMQTATEASVRQAQSLKYIGMAIKNADAGLIEPMGEKFYDYNMNDPDIQVGKGNYLVQALGFSSFQNKTERLKILNMMLDRCLTAPPVGMMSKIDWIWSEMLKAVDMDPDQVIKTPEEKKQDIANQLQQPQQALALKMQEATIAKTESGSVKDKAMAVKALADAKKSVLDVEQMTSLAGQEGQPQAQQPESQPQEPSLAQQQPIEQAPVPEMVGVQ